MLSANYQQAFKKTSAQSVVAIASVRRLLVELIMASCLIISGCAITPETIVKQPMTAKPPSASGIAATNGAIFNAAAYRPMFEDRRPRFVGDIVTVNIAESTVATKANDSSASKAGSVDASVTSLFNHPAPKATFAGKSALSYSDKDAANASNVFTGTITATVVDVLPNGNLVISGDKQVSFDKGTEFVRFSGVVNPDTISIGNSVSSTKIADARIEYRTNTKIDAAGVASMFARFFLSMVPL